MLEQHGLCSRPTLVCLPACLPSVGEMEAEEGVRSRTSPTREQRPHPCSCGKAEEGEVPVGFDKTQALRKEVESQSGSPTLTRAGSLPLTQPQLYW